MKIKNKGFLLFEVVISIVIITAGVLFVMRAFSSAKESIERSTEVFKVSLLLEQKMWGFEEKGKIEEGRESGDFEEDEGYSWKLASERLEDSDLNLVRLEAFQKEQPEITKYFITTYLKNKTE
ncbi:MAG: hypothetical protein ISS92_01175 [Candidatus Omnitrophica bacterium]|nr:hypothetical protein [Candidatus Omnitrophota bacterium]